MVARDSVLCRPRSRGGKRSCCWLAQNDDARMMISQCGLFVDSGFRKASSDSMAPDAAPTGR